MRTGTSLGPLSRGRRRSGWRSTGSTTCRERNAGRGGGIDRLRVCVFPRALVAQAAGRDSAENHMRKPNLPGWLLVVLVTVLAEAGIRLFELQDSVAAPSAALRALVDGLWSGTLSGEVATTLEGYIEGLAVATVLGVALGLAIGSWRTLLDALSVVIEFLRPIPAVALIPVAILFFGLGMPMRRFVIAYAALWPILIGTLYG